MTNKTSEAVREETNLAPRYKAICEKYLRMEVSALSALECIERWRIDTSGDNSLIAEAHEHLSGGLAYDPLSSSPNSL